MLRSLGAPDCDGDIVYNLECGNTASTTHFLALHRCLLEGRIATGQRVLLLSFASGVVVGAVLFDIDDELVRPVRARQLRRWPPPPSPGAGSRALAVRAAKGALGAAGRAADEVEILVNAGVYRDENIIEPAMGPFIQRGIGANSTFPPLNGTRTFSFDLANGAGGPLTAIRVIDGFMRSGAVRSGLVVASDADPDPSRSENYPFAATGGAILLRASASGEGFAWFHARTWSEHFPLYDARLCGTGALAPESEAWSARGQRLRFVQQRGLRRARRRLRGKNRRGGGAARAGSTPPRSTS